jgi:hypothetical protein
MFFFLLSPRPGSTLIERLPLSLCSPLLDLSIPVQLLLGGIVVLIALQSPGCTGNTRRNLTKRGQELWGAQLGEKVYNNGTLLPVEEWMYRDSDSDRVTVEPCVSLWLEPSSGPALIWILGYPGHTV